MQRDLPSFSLVTKPEWRIVIGQTDSLWRSPSIKLPSINLPVTWHSNYSFRAAYKAVPNCSSTREHRTVNAVASRGKTTSGNIKQKFIATFLGFPCWKIDVSIYDRSISHLPMFRKEILRPSSVWSKPEQHLLVCLAYSPVPKGAALAYQTTWRNVPKSEYVSVSC
jgi:hypothetical protein